MQKRQLWGRSREKHIKRKVAVRCKRQRRGARRLGGHLFNEMLDALSIGVAATTREGRIVYANSRFAQTLGIPGDQNLAGTELRSLISPGCWHGAAAALGSETRGPADCELRVESADQKPRVIRLSFTPMQRLNGVRIQIVATDITEFAEANEILRKTEASLHSVSGRIMRVQDEERRRIARDLHDTTGQELAMVVMSLAHLAKNLEQPDGEIRKAIEDAAKMVRKIEQEVRTLSYLLHPPLLDELGLASALRSYVEGFNKRSGIQVILEVPPKLRRLSTEKEMALFRVAQESLTNVLRHSGSRTARIEVQESEGQLLVSVEDNGRGIDRETLAKLTNGNEMIGVGIAGIRERLLQFGGRLEVHSGQAGTRIVASVPVAESGASEKTAQALPELPAFQTFSGPCQLNSRKQILVVEDHEMTRQGIRALLEDQADLEVCGEAQDGLEAVLKAKELKPDLIIMDLAMPSVGGLSATHRIRELGAESKILMLTTHEFDGLERMIEKSGCDGIVVKSNASQDLLHAVRTVLEGKRFFNGERSRARNG